MLRLVRTEGSTSLEKVGLFTIEGPSGYDKVEWGVASRRRHTEGQGILTEEQDSSG